MGGWGWGGYKMEGGGTVKFYPYKKAEKVLAMLKWGGGGGRTSFALVLTRELEVLATLMGGWGGGAKGFRPLKGGCNIFTLC